MADQNIHTNYSLADIQRYLQGSMSAKEMHDMERAALQDPFLADAIEGYREASFDKAHRHLNEINAALQSSENEIKIMTMPAKSFQWWKVAAMIILLAGAGVSGWYALKTTSASTEVQQVAQKKESQKFSTDTIKMPDSNAKALAKVQSKERNTIPNAAGTPKSEDVFAQKNPGLSESKDLRHDPEVRPDSFSSKDEASLRDNVVSSGLAKANVPEAPSYQSKQKQFKLLEGISAQNNIAFNGRIVNKNNEPVPNAFIKITGNDDSIATDPDGYFSFKSQDSLASVSISAPGNNPLDTQLYSSKMNRLTLTEKPSWLSTIPLVKMETKKKDSESNARKDSTMPVGGWQSFQEYVYNKLHKKMDTTLTSVVVSGDVEIEFFVNEKGVPYNFKIVKSLDDDSDAKAIELLKKGPLWITSNKNKKGKVTIQF